MIIGDILFNPHGHRPCNRVGMLVGVGSAFADFALDFFRLCRVYEGGRIYGKVSSVSLSYVVPFLQTPRWGEKLSYRALKKPCWKNVYLKGSNMICLVIFLKSYTSQSLFNFGWKFFFEVALLSMSIHFNFLEAVLVLF